MKLYQNKLWFYQKTESECWLCALQNALLLLNYNINSKEIFKILNDKHLILYDNMAFFPYIAVILDTLNIKCHFVIDSDNALLDCIIDNNKNISHHKLQKIIRKTRNNNDFTYYFYLSLKIILSSSFVTVTLNEPKPIIYLNNNALIIACLYITDLYKGDLEQILHTVTAFKKEDKVILIDPYYKLGLKYDINWKKYQQQSYKFDWSNKIPYFIAIDM